MANRRQLDLAAMSGTCTRSRSEIFIHRTRSGRARSDPKRRQPAPVPKLNDRRRNSVKDLRLKRVFSDHKAKFDMDNDRVDEKRNGYDGFENSKESSDNSGEDSMRTAPDIDMMSGSDGGKDIRVPEKTNLGKSPQNKQGLSPCSRLKLIRDPSSVSYRRLLPYLKDLVNDGSSVVEILQSHNFPSKVENPMKASQFLNLSSEQQNHSLPLGDFPVPNSGRNHDSDINPVLQTPAPNSHQEIVHESIKVESPKSCSESKLTVLEYTAKMGFDDNNVNELNEQEKKGANKERDGTDAKSMKVPDEISGDIVQSTPPDAELASKFEGTEHGSRRAISKPAYCRTSKNSSGLVSCSRSKLYRNPSSFSYRRLLPYLMDLAKNSSSGLEIIHSQNSATAVENNIEERPSMLNNIPLPKQQHHTIPLVDSSSMHSRENQDSEVNHVSESLGLDSQEDIHDPVTAELPNSCNKIGVQLLEVGSEISLEKSDFEFEMLSKSSVYTPTISEDLSVEELAGIIPELSSSPMELDRMPTPKVSQIKTFGHGVNRALAPRKSILKKQSRGCNGICTCLDCTMFRVHAESAYEFSRRQMTDADEVVNWLSKELSCLRNLMERSLVSMVNGAESFTVLQVNQDQVKGVCQRAFRVEEQAKIRMRQMFCDLNTHCRVPGPRVTFSDYVDERNIP